MLRNISHVINFDVPVIYDDYVHRIGRTGGLWLPVWPSVFVTPADDITSRKLKKLIREKIGQSICQIQAVESTPYEENQTMAREIDRQKKVEDPNYQGAFHERKK